MLKTIWSWMLVFLAAICLPSSPVRPMTAPTTTELTVSYTGIIEFLDLFATPDYYLEEEIYAQGDNLEEIRHTAEVVTAPFDNTYDKIKAVSAYVSDLLYYDYQYLEGIEFRSQDVYEVFTTGIAVCQGYSDLATVMLRSVGIPCMTSTSTSHAYNFAYDGDTWVFFDPTWCSSNKFTVDGEMLYEGADDMYFDLTSHEIEKLGVGHQTVQIICGPATAVLNWDDHTATIKPSQASLPAV